MKEQILEIIKTKPKHFSRIIQNDPELKQWILENTLLETGKFVNHIYSAVNQETNICINGNTKKFKSILSGFGFCGKASECICCKQAVSIKVSVSKNQTPIDSIEASNRKREQTNIERYGVANTGQTNSAKEKHRKFYDSTESTFKAVEKHKQTMLQRYGVDSPQKLDSVKQKAKDTIKQRYDIDNIVFLSRKASNPGLKTLQDVSLLSEMCEKYSITEIAAELQVTEDTVYRYLNKHKLRRPFVSSGEQEIVNFLTSIGITNIVSNSRKIISSEIDIYVPDHNLCIEFNGEYWHGDHIPHITRDYHLKKFRECSDKGLLLLSIFSLSWKNNKELWKQIIKERVGLLNDVYITEIGIEDSTRTINANSIHPRNIITSKESKSIAVIAPNNKIIDSMLVSDNQVVFSSLCHSELITYCSRFSRFETTIDNECSSSQFTHLAKEIYQTETLSTYYDPNLKTMTTDSSKIRIWDSGKTIYRF